MWLCILSVVKDGEERATCKVDGVTYYDGYSFIPKSDPRLNCICLPGYTGTKRIWYFCDMTIWLSFEPKLQISLRSRLKKIQSYSYKKKIYKFLWYRRKQILEGNKY